MLDNFFFLKTLFCQSVKKKLQQQSLSFKIFFFSLSQRLNDSCIIPNYTLLLLLSFISKCFFKAFTYIYLFLQQWNIISLRYFNPVGAHPSGLVGEDPTRPFTNLMPFIGQVATGKKDELVIYGGDYDTEDGTGKLKKRF